MKIRRWSHKNSVKIHNKGIQKTFKIFDNIYIYALKTRKEWCNLGWGVE